MRKLDDLPPGFWCEYVPPATHVSAAIQYPATDKLWPDRVVTAYMRDWRDSRRALQESQP